MRCYICSGCHKTLNPLSHTQDLLSNNGISIRRANWIAKQILTFKLKFVSKTLLTFFQEKSRGTWSLVSTERRREWEAYCSFACLVRLLALYCHSLLCFSGHLFCTTNKQMHKQIRCNFFSVCCTQENKQIVLMILNPRVQFLILVLLQHDFVLSL